MTFEVLQRNNLTIREAVKHTWNYKQGNYDKHERWRRVKRLLIILESL